MESKRGHLTREECDAYIRRTLSPSDLLAVDDHLQGCNDCMGLIDQSNSSPSGSFLVSEILSNTEAGHLTFEQVSAYVDGASDEVDVSIVEFHLGDCEACRTEVDAIAALRDRLAETGPASRTVEPDSGSGSWLNWKILIPVFGLLVLGAALFLGLPQGLLDGDSSLASVDVSLPEIEPPPGLDEDLSLNENVETAEPAVSLRDGNGTIAVRPDGSILGADGASSELSRSLKNALETGQVEVGERVAVAGSGTLMSGDREGVPFGLTAPVGRVVLSQRPVFTWKPLAGAQTYSVRVFDENFIEVLSSGEITGNSWTAAKPLPRGRHYLWQVTAKNDGESVISPVRPAPDARFRIVDAASAEQIDIAEKRFPRSNLIRGIAYAKAGMVNEAEREFSSLVKKNPGSAVAQRLLQQVRRTR